jgi:hypothetical protein
MRVCFSIVVAGLIGSSTAGEAVAQEPAPLLLQVIHLKPGESRFIELAFGEGFRPAGQSGRSDLFVHLLSTLENGKPKPVAAEKAVEGEHFKAAPHKIADGVELRWSANKPGIELRADTAAPASTCDVRVTYNNFGGKGHVAAWRVVVGKE